MGIYSDRLIEEVRLERMRPEQIERAKARRAAIYVPFGSIEWHGYHNPVGLDAIKAHEQLVGLAQQAGGVVYPAVFFGSGGGHLDWPSSLMVSAEPMIRLVCELLHGFEQDGYAQAILLSGHYPNRPVYLDQAIELFRSERGKMRILAIIENQAPGVPGDHAALHETSSLLYLHPETVDAARLGIPAEGLSDGETHNWMGDEYAGHPCYGLVGIDPRGRASAAAGQVSTENLIAYLREWLGNGAAG
jgi:creatinine amidohydrolase